MRRLSEISLTTIAGLLLTSGSSTLAAPSLLLDFGPTAIATGYGTNSPAHAIDAVPATEVTWNQIAGDTNTLYYSDGTAAAGITLDLGRSADGIDTIDFTDNGFSVSALGASISTGVYAGTSPVKDGIFGGSVSANLALGLRVDGLPAGTYTLYFHGRNTSGAFILPQRFYVANLPSAESFAFSPASINTTILNSAPAVTNGFVPGDNFGTLSVALGAGESLYLACEGVGAPEYRGFMNTVEICPGIPELPLKITAQPVNRTILDGADATLMAGVSGPGPIHMQWRLNGVDLADGPTISGVNSRILVLKEVPANMTGSTNLYTLFVTNAAAQTLSAAATLTLTAVTNTTQASRVWTLRPGERSYLGDLNTERGLAYNPATENLLLASRQPAERIVVLNASSGAEKHFLDMTGIPASTPGSLVSLGMHTLSVNSIGVSDDGAVFATSLTPNASTYPLAIYRWATDGMSSVPSTVFSSDPATAVQSGLRWGDSVAVRGAGADTQILLAPGSGTRVVLLRTSSGLDFQNEIPPAVITVSGVTSAFGQFGLAFGPGTNTFWAKTSSGLLYLVEFDLGTLTGYVLRSYPATKVPASVRGIGVNTEQTFLAGVAVESPGDNLRIYDISDLVDGPVMRDQEPFQTQVPNYLGTAAVKFGAGYIFSLDSNNGLQAVQINPSYATPVSIVSHPTNRTVLEGASVTFVSVAAGTPRSMRWRFNGTDLVEGPDVIGVGTSMLTLHNVTPSQAGGYSLFVSNPSNSVSSTEAVLTVVPAANTAQMTNIWTLQPLSRTYLGTNSTERGLAFNAATMNLLLVSRNPFERVVVLDPATGAEKHFLNVTGVGSTTAGVVLGLNAIGVAEDGAVYAANLAVNAANTAFKLYRWQDDSPGVAPVVVFSGDPGAGVQTGLRWSDVMAVRGQGSDTQVLIAPGTGTNVALLRSTSGLNFQTEIPPAIIAVKGVTSGFAQYGIAFGPGTNTFWAKTAGGSLFLVEFDLIAKTGQVLRTYSTGLVGSSLRGIAVDETQKYLSGINVETSDTVRLFDISNPDLGPIQRDVEAFASLYAQSSIGVTAFGANYLFALDGNNGLQAFLLDETYVPPLPEFSITTLSRLGTSAVLTWPSTLGVNYQVQYRDSLSAGGWVNVGNTITAAGSTLSYTNTGVNANTRFYRVRGL